MKIGPKYSAAPKRDPRNRIVIVPIAPYAVHCAECGTQMKLLTEVTPEGFVASAFYGCPKYPACYCTHSAHRDGRPMGVPANEETRRARRRAHAAFDELWRPGRGFMSRGDAYRWLAHEFGVSEVHIGAMDLEQAERTAELSRRKLVSLQVEREMVRKRVKREIGNRNKQPRARLDGRRQRTERFDRKQERQGDE